MLMFDNACKYNEPDSQIYKDALTLQNVVVRTAKTLAEEDMDESAVPKVIEAVQEILSHIFSQMYNQQGTYKFGAKIQIFPIPYQKLNFSAKIQLLGSYLFGRFSSMSST